MDSKKRIQFIQDAKNQGYSDTQINAYLEKKGQPTLNLLDTIHDIPIVGGIEQAFEPYARMLGGMGFEGARGIASVLGDTDAYYNKKTGRTVENPFLNEEDLRPFSNPVSGMMEGGKRTLDAASEAALLWGLPGLVKGIPKVVGRVTHPIESLGKLRSSILKGKSVGTGEMQSEILHNLESSKYFQQAGSATQKEAIGRAVEFLRNLNPMETVGEGASMRIQQAVDTPLARVYENLAPFETMGRAYTKSGEMGGTAIGQGTNLVSHAIRDYMRTAAPGSANTLTDIMRILYGGQKLVGPALKYVIPYYLISEAIKGGIGALKGK